MGVQNNLIVLEYQAKIDSLEKALAKVEASEKQLASSGKKAMAEIEGGAKKASTATQTMTKNTSELKNKLSELASQLPFVNQIKQVTELGSALTGAGNQAKNASSGFQVLKAAIIGSGIGALVIALIALITYFRRTDEGAAKLSGILSALGSAADLVTGAIVGIGEAIFNAATSFDGFKELLSSIGDFLIGQLVNRFYAVVQALTAFKDLIVDFVQNGTSADFEGALNKIASAQTDFLTGVKDSQKKISEWTAQVAAAAQAAYDWELRMDHLQDKMREDSVLIAKNDAAITKLIIASKNKQTADEESLAMLNKASELEEQNLAIVLNNEKAKLALIQEKNKREQESINQDKKNLTDELFARETSANRRKAILNELRSINDKDAQEEVDQINKITALNQASDNLLEKINNRRDNKLEEIFQNNIKRLSQEEILLENIAKGRFLSGVTTAQELEDELYQIKLEGLHKQKELLISDSRDIVDIDKAILDLELQNRLKSDKEKADLQKAANERALKEEKDRLAKEAKYKADFDKQQEEKEKQHQANITIIKQGAIQIAQDLISGLFSNSNEKRQQELQIQLDSSQKETDNQIDQLQKRLDAGTIGEEEFNRKKLAIQANQEKKEAEIKTKQFQANKKAALTNIAIDTAAAIVKTLATLGIPAGIAGAAVAAALGLAQAAVVASQSTPKFAKGKINIQGPGTSTSDSITAQLSKGESVMTADETSAHIGSLQAMRNRNYDKYIHKNYVVPAMEKMQRESISRREAQMNQAMNISNSFDSRNMERILKKNGTVNLSDSSVSSLAKQLAKQNTFNDKFYR